MFYICLNLDNLPPKYFEESFGAFFHKQVPIQYWHKLLHLSIVQVPLV